jgi:hypothetical protein
MLSRKGFKGKGKKLLASKKALMNRSSKNYKTLGNSSQSSSSGSRGGKNSQKKQGDGETGSS